MTEAGGTLAVRADGPAQGRALVLLHSLGLDGRMWDPVIPAWSEARRVIRVDLPGHGRSAARPRPATLAGLADAVLEAVDREVSGPFELCGLSLGGQVALQLAITRPDRVARLVACATGAKIGDAEGWQQRIAAIRSGGMAAIFDLALSRYFAPGFSARDPRRYTDAQDALRSVDPGAYVACCEALRDADLRDLVSTIAAPTLLLAGREDASTPPSLMAALEASIEGARLEVIPGAAHILSLEAPAATEAAVLRFLRE